MADKIVEIPGAGRIAFPDSMTDAQINAAATRLYQQANPTKKQPPVKSWMDTATEWAGDAATGFAKGAAHTAIDLGQAVHAIPGVGAVTEGIGNFAGGVAGQALYGTKAQPAASGPAFADARARTQYTNPAQMVGGAAETLAELAVPGVKAADAIPSTARAGAKFQSVMGAAKNIAIDTSAPGDVALRISQLAERGGSMPMVVRKFLARVTDPAKADLTYEEARDFASNVSRLSADEYGRLTPVVAREVANLRVSLNGAIAKAAEQAGKGADYTAAMREYAQAMRIRDAVNGVVEGAKKGLPYATAVGAGSWLASRVKRAFSE